MPRSVWEVFLSLFQGDEESNDDPDTKEDANRFVPSPLDLSVRIGHGGSDDERVRELAKMRQQARDIEEEQRGT